MNKSMIAAVMMGSLVCASVCLAEDKQEAGTACKPSVEQRDNLRFGGADWSAMSFSRMNLMEREFVFLRLNDADFAHARLRGAVFSGARIHDGKFFGVRAATANFSHACLKGADFRKADLRKADFTGASLRGARLWGAKLSGTVWKNTVCPDGTNSDANGGTCEGHLRIYGGRES